MTKSKIDETRKSRAKGPAETPATEENGTEPKAAESLADTKPRGRKAEKAPREKAPRENLVVFAFRLRPEERALIHKAAGPAKASRFVRALVTAASRGDVKAVTDIVATVQTS